MEKKTEKKQARDLKWLKKKVDNKIKHAELRAKFMESDDKAYHEGLLEGMAEVRSMVDCVSQPTLSVVPQYVASFIEDSKGNGLNLQEAYSNIEYYPVSRMVDYVGDNPELFARAWLDGYTVEEKKFYVKDNLDRLMLRKYSYGVGEVNVGTMSVDSKWFESKSYELTEQEVKDYDERYVPFMVPVEEKEEEEE